MQDGVVIKGLAPKHLDPSRYQLTVSPSHEEPEANMPWRSIRDELGKFKWLDHRGKIYSGIPYSVEPDVNSKQMFVVSMMHASSQAPVLKDVPDVTCPSDPPTSQKRREVVQFDQPAASSDRKPKRIQPNDGKSNVVIKAKSIPVSPKTVASSTGAMREKWLQSIYKEIENFLQNMAIDDVKKAIYGLREAPRLWQQERDQHLRELQFVYIDRSVHLVQSYIHPSLWFIAEGPKEPTMGIPPFDNKLRSDEWTAQLHQHKILGYVGVYVDDLLIAGPRTLNDTLIKAVQGIWKTSAPEHLGPDPDCVPILRFLGMNLERVDEARSEELNLPVGSILLNQMEYILEVLLKFEPSLQLKTRTTPGNQESFSPSSTMTHDRTVAEYLDSLQMLIAGDIIDAEVAAKSSPKLHYNSDQVVINLPAMGSRRCLLCTDRGEESARNCCLPWYHLQFSNGW